MIPAVKLQDMMEKHIIQIAPLAFMRGRTLSDAVVILDEAQNTTSQQIRMFLTRMGMNTKMIITGDLTQIDLPREQRSGLKEALKILDGVEGIGVVKLGQKDIVRHVMESPDLRGIVMHTFGSGNAPHTPWIMRLLDQAAHRGVNIVNISQCLTGSVEMERYGAGFQLKAAHVISGYDSTVEAMVTKMMYLQGRYADNKKVREKLTESLAGEISI